VCLERGWREFNSETGDQWNLWWRTSGFSVNHHRNLYAWQVKRTYINHIPKGSAICRKDNLVRYLRCMRKVYGSIYDFSPHGYNLPLEYTKLAAECSRNGRPFSSKSDAEDKLLEEKPIWICKPVAQSQGRGIFLFRKLSELSYDSNTIVQRYIEKPLLIGGYKFDLRLYVCIPSYHPVTIYMYKEGLARFGTDKFSLNDLRNPFRHLTNCSINKLGPGYTEMKDRIGSGCKWTLRQLRRYFQQAGISDWLLWQRISSLVILTVLSHVNQIPPTVNCFEFFGFDVLIDSSLRPWLLEVNLSPALSNDCDADRSVKKPMLHDMFDLLGLPLYNTGLSVFDIWLDESDENNTEEDKVERTKDALTNSLPVLNAADRWRRKHRKMSARQVRSRSSSAAHAPIRTVSATIPSNFRFNNFSKLLTFLIVEIIHLPKSNYNLPKNKPNYETNKHLLTKMFQSIEDLKKIANSKKWGNGRDWNCATSSEGGWIRIWPIVVEPLNKSNTSNVKQMVSTVIKYTKTAKDLVKNHPTASECQLNEFLQQEMKMSGEIWIPPV
ncbi:tubulin polyglutamylase TTLL2, partial [Asbolus verrucosus]